MNKPLLTTTRLEELIRSALRGHVAADYKLSEDSTLTELGLTSLQLSELVIELEDTLNVEFDLVQLASVKTAGELVHAINASIEQAQEDDDNK